MKTDLIMWIAVILLFAVLSSCVVRQSTRVFDSTYIRRDSISWKVKKDTLNGITDSLRYQKSYVTLSHSPGWLKIKKGTWYFLGFITLALAFLITKNNSN